MPDGRNAPPAADPPDGGGLRRPEPMSRVTRIVLGFLTVWSVVYALAALQMDLSAAQDGDSFFGPEIQAVSAINALVVFCAYTYLALRSKRMRAIDKTGWIFAMLFLYPFVVPLFWYLHVWRPAPSMPSPDDAGRTR